MPDIFKDWQEVHSGEYVRISNALGRLNLADINVHNKKAILECAPEKQLMRAEMNALFGIEVIEEGAEEV